MKNMERQNWRPQKTAHDPKHKLLFVKHGCASVMAVKGIDTTLYYSAGQ